ncbi:hypothetical protein ACFPAG_15385 [Vogesella sp. GCM10023246]|uniref:Uncharacterized protein n=1 Tax=Vogesella oryzagri TaxID=3160864 RepID=A0ABV1M716_9NEIS
MRKPAPLAGVAQEQHLQMLATMLGKSLAEKGVEIAPLPRGFAPENIRLEADQIAAFRVLLELQLQTSFLPLKAVDAGAPQWAFSVNMIIHHLTAFPASRFCSAVTMPVARFSELQSADVIVPALRSCIQQLEPVDLP